jgi:putative ribosome biogenesis GTPase RsgA
VNEQEVLVSIDVQPILEERFVDSLLAMEIVESFNSLVVNAHNCCAHDKMSLAEQVAGRQKQVNFQVYVLESNYLNLIEQLKECFSGAGIQYWVLPVLDKGNL